jgi:hypothetical protein
MGAYSTLWVSREAALRKLGELHFGGMSDDMIEKMLDAAYNGSLRNFQISNAPRDDEELAAL